ncbi:hypothetical protein M5X17_15460 [Paenibacillus alvei]|nr:hypothetical protein [Paenibacillus alvei]EJW17257.1 hypothetical protein PAV_4c03600 [Paenibacillus alvei DSM 29]MCY9542305.1 hypothetical protein [Paenibacillus alvei]MCY9735118.1 hypothetical protein [Paenibacillus alvei]MCY9764515.1 hypothetical protein [Paenibacillus alvei]MCY9770963.1 hypothetical protein [Paenibacillus alvei]
MRVCSELEKQQINNLYTTVNVEELVGQTIFYNGVLDIFPKTLTEAESKNIDFLELYKLHEHRYLALFRDIYQKNGSSIYVRPFTTINTSNKYLSKKGIAKDEQKFIRQLSKNENQLLKIEFIEELDVLVKATIREIVLSIFYLEDMFVIGNYDLSLPVSSLTEETLIFTGNLAKEHGLYLRR